MEKTKISRKELLKKSDEFITFSARVIIFARDHSRQFAYLGAILIGIIIIYLGVSTYTKHINKKGQEAYNIAYYSMLKNTGSEPTREELKKAENLFSGLIDKYSSSKAAGLAHTELAYIKFLSKEYDEAIAQYKQFVDELSDNDPYLSLGRLALATCYEENGENDKAIQTLENITAGQDDFFKEQAMLSLARIYRTVNKKEKSDKILKEFIEKFNNSPFLPLAKSHLNS